MWTYFTSSELTEVTEVITVCVWEERGETGDWDGLGVQSTLGARNVCVVEPGVGFIAELFQCVSKFISLK